jgi:hypothetical protein
MKNTIPFVLSGIFLLLLMLSPSPARAGSSPLTISDLEQTINTLPERENIDPANPLLKRLAELNSKEIISDEQAGLKQAVALIKILRQTRITASHSASDSHIALLLTSQISNR